MIYLTQLIYINEGQEKAFLEFESIVLPLLEKHFGKLELRTRPTPETWVAGAQEMPYEIHLVSFDSKGDLQSYINDENRKKVIHLKEQSIKSITLITGERNN